MRSSFFRRTGALVATLGLVSSTACYTFQPIAGAPAPTSTVQLRLTPDGTTQLTSQVGPDVQGMEGVLTAVRGDTLLVTVSTIETRSRGTMFMRGATVSVPINHVAELRVQRFDRKRTALAAVLGTATAVGIVIGVTQGGSSGGNNIPGGPPTTATRIPR